MEGKKFDGDKPMFNLIVPEYLNGIAKVLTMGAQKYDVNNWQKIDSDRYIAALYRHLIAYHSGEKVDLESGFNHMLHIACNAMFLFWSDINKKGDK